MRPVVVSEFVTLDGVMEAPGGEPGHPHTGWVIDFQGPEQIEYKMREAQQAGALLIGRVTYESFAGAWPKWTGEFADRMNTMPKHVVSTTLRNPAWNNTSVISGKMVEEVRRLKQQPGGPLLTMGSLTLVHALMAAKLVDEYRVMTFPVLVGSGRRLFPQTPDKTVLRLVRTHTFPSGAVENTYQPV